MMFSFFGLLIKAKSGNVYPEKGTNRMFTTDKRVCIDFEYIYIYFVIGFKVSNKVL
jgi:hypothetical protein